MDGVTPAEAAAPAPWNGTIPRTRFFDALSLLLPAGESFVIEALETCGTEAVGCDPAAESVLACFVREERAHQRAHRLYNRALIAATPAAAAPAQRADEAVAQLQGLPLIHRVALAAAFEQLTAVLSQEVLEHRHLLGDARTSSPQSRLWRWHAAEELRHCHVAMQAAQRCGVGTPQRVIALCMATAYLAMDVLRGWITLCSSDIAAGARRRAVVLDTLDFMWRSLPSLARMTLGWWRCVLLPRRAPQAAQESLP